MNLNLYNFTWGSTSVVYFIYFISFPPFSPPLFPPFPPPSCALICFPPLPCPCSELFTNCLDMICTLLQSLSSEFHISLAGWGEEGKKSHTTCIKKLKTELANSKSYCSSEIRQLFPLSQKSYSVITVKTPPSVSFSKGVTSNERIKVAHFLSRHACG